MTMSIQHRVIGQLTSDAHARMALGGSYIVMLELQQTNIPKGQERPPIVAAYQLGHGASAAIAANSKAAQLRRGTRVRVWCTGIGLGYTHDDVAAIRLVGVDSVEIIEAPTLLPVAPPLELTHVSQPGNQPESHQP
jgi:hypothetical protein